MVDSKKYVESYQVVKNNDNYRNGLQKIIMSSTHKSFQIFARKMSSKQKVGNAFYFSLLVNETRKKFVKTTQKRVK